MKAIRPSHFINRELSWLEFNGRVLEEAMDATHPLLERLKFFTIFSSNLDEFFEVRVAGIKQQIESGVAERSLDGLTPSEIFQLVARRVRRLVDQQYACWRRDLVPALARNRIQFLEAGRIGPEDRAWIDACYRAEVRPVLTPLALDPTHPFPLLLNKSLNLIVQLDWPAASASAQHRLLIVQVPRVLPRLVRLPRADGRLDYLFLGQLIGDYLSDLLPGARIQGCWAFRVTRNSELYIDEEEETDTGNLLQAVEKELHKRRRGDAVRLEVESGCPPPIRAILLQNLQLSEVDLYEIDGPLDPVRLMKIHEDAAGVELRDAPYHAPYPAAFREPADPFAAIRKSDVLVHHPFETYEAVVDFLEQAAEDPQVLAIKQTLYRTGGDTRIVGALMRAVNHGKQVTVTVELKARFDEANNILWARKLEEAGVHVVYGLVGYKIHAKACLVVRREESGLRRYVHLSTGNYNPTTARIYTDLSLFTCHPDFGEDVTSLFNLLTGICQFPGMRKLLIAPFNLQERFIELIRREADHARQGLPARIIAKMNALVDRGIIEALYSASQAGVKIDLLVRGICCLRPQVRGLSQNITVRSILDRFLEHSRIYYFENACQPQVFVGSADWMPRNFFSRIETVFPIENGVLRERLIDESLGIPLADNVKARVLLSSGRYVRQTVPPGEKPVRSQIELMRRAQAGAASPLRPKRGARKELRLRSAPPPAEPSL